MHTDVFCDRDIIHRKPNSSALLCALEVIGLGEESLRSIIPCIYIFIGSCRLPAVDRPSNREFSIGSRPKSLTSRVVLTLCIHWI